MAPIADPDSAVRAARSLLREDELAVPAAVEQTARFLAERGVWFRLSRNAEAHSCRDAARKRQRLGHTGIPLRDEMKSFFGQVPERHGDGVRFVVAHCRADRRLDLAALAAAIGSERLPERLAHEELAAFGLAYGLVNPFEQWQPHALDGRFIHAPVLQVFDVDLLRRLGTPGTIMTNAGDLTWGVELRPEQLFDALSAGANGTPAPLRAAIAEQEDAARRPHLDGRRSIAIVTGNAPESGMALWEAVNGRVRRLLGDENAGDASMPPVRVVSLPELGMTMELDARADDVWDALRPVVEELCEGDVALLAIACNTTQYFVERIRAICEPAGVAFVSLPEVVAAWLGAHRVRDVALVGIPYVAQLDGGWSAYADPLQDFDVEQLADGTLERLVELAYRVKEDGPTQGGLNRLRSILSQGVQSSHVVLALTELSILLPLQRKGGRSGKTIVDPVALYAEALARRWLGLPYPAPSADWEVQATGLTHPGGRTAPDDASRARNEDAVLLGDRVLATPASEPVGGDPRVHQEVHALRRAARPADVVVVAVADGLGSHAAGARASRLVLTRLRDASARLRDPDEIEAVLEEASVALRYDAERAGDPHGAARGATVAGFVLSVVGEGDMDACWFSVGDCLLLQLEPAASHDGDPTLRLLCLPAATPDGHPSGAVGAEGVAIPTTRRVPPPDLREGAVLLCCTDGFPASFGIRPVDRGLAERLGAHERLRPVWRRLASGRGDPGEDREAVQALADEALRAVDASNGGRQRLDNLSLAVTRIHRAKHYKT